MSSEKYRLIRVYELELATPECVPTATSWRVKMNLQDDITEVLPYLNAELQNRAYDHNSKVLLWDEGGRKYAFRPFEIDIAPVMDRGEAEGIAEKVVGMINEVWNRKHEIAPCIEGERPLPNLLDIYRLLPKTNCKECGYSTCMAFATKLRIGKVELAQCPPLTEKQGIGYESLRTLLCP